MIRRNEMFLCIGVLALANLSVETHAIFHSKKVTVIPSSTVTTDFQQAYINASPPPPTSPSTAIVSSADTDVQEAHDDPNCAQDVAAIKGVVVDPSASITPQDYRNALVKTCVTVSCATLFGVFLTITRGKTTGYEFFSSYLVEQSLSIDNIFVFIMLFDYFQVPLESQSRVLAWGIAGAIALRGIMIMAGVAVLQRFKSVLLFFAAILLASSYKLLTESIHPQHDGSGHLQDHNDHLKNNIVMKIASFLFPNTLHEFHGDAFFVQQQGQRFATPLFLCLVCVELSDFVFAVDSIPAVLGVTQDPLVVYSSNIFAIMALRSLYTVVAKAVSEWHYLKPAVALVLGFVGMKMVLEYFHVAVGTDFSLGVICTLLGGGVALSVWDKRWKEQKQQQQGQEQHPQLLTDQLNAVAPSDQGKLDV